MIVLGVDPGSVRTGWGVIRREGPRLYGVDAGVIETDDGDALERRLLAIHDGLCEVIERHRPDCMAVEDIFHARYARAALKLGQARGAALIAGARGGLVIAAYPPARVKRAVAGRGQASKPQIARMVGAVLGWRELPALDATDALAVAITHANALTSSLLTARAATSPARRRR